MADPCLRHVVHVPSNPIGYTAGKYMEWYPDVVETPGEVTDRVPKPGWQPGWRAQHDRLVSAMSGMRRRVPLVLSGDIHSIAEQRIVRAGSVDLGANPVVSVITATPATGVGWPSVARSTLAQPPTGFEVETVVPVQELNGFHLVDFEPDRVVIRHYRWDRLRQSEAEIDTLEPFQVSEYRRPA
jgi:phosphodiesterase/alkaline phosphatase D-like protein